MAKKSSRYNVHTDAELEPADSRMPKGALSMHSLSTMNGLIYEEVKEELRWPKNSKVYKQMLLDSAVDTPYRLIELLLTRPDARIVVPDSASAEEKKRCDKLNHNLDNMYRHFNEYLSEAISFIVFGHWEGEKVFQKMSSPYGDYVGISDIRTISQDTIEKWFFNTDTKQLAGLRQSLTNIHSDTQIHNGSGYVDIPRAKFIHLRNGVKRDNPEGRSVLNSCYVNWKYKAILEEYQSIGVVKDLSGIPVFEIDAAYLSKANLNPSGNEAKTVENLRRLGQAMHAGELSCGIVPVSWDDRNNKLFNFKLLGVEGGGKQYDPLEVIKYHSNCILISFFADVLALGSSSSGSFALSDNKMSLLSLSIQSWINNIRRSFDRDFIKHIYKMNRWEYDSKSSCRFKFDDVDDGAVEYIAGAVQKAMAVGAIRPTEDIENRLRDVLLDLPPVDDSTVFLQTKNESGAGEGMTEGLGNGVGQSTSKGADRSVANISKDTL